MSIETLAPYAAGLGVSIPVGGATAAARSGEVGAGLALGLGVMYAALTVVASSGGYYAGTVEDRIGVRNALLIVPTVMAVALLVPLWVALLALPAFAAMRTAKPLVQPIANGYINDHVEEVGRATLLSVVSMFYMMLRAPLALGAGMVADTTTATMAIGALGGLFLAAGGTIWLLSEVAPETETTVGEKSSSTTS